MNQLLQSHMVRRRQTFRRLQLRLLYANLSDQPRLRHSLRHHRTAVTLITQPIKWEEEKGTAPTWLTGRARAFQEALLSCFSQEN